MDRVEKIGWSRAKRGVIECDWCNRVKLIDYSGIDRVEWNRWDITGWVWKIYMDGVVRVELGRVEWVGKSVKSGTERDN